MEVVAHGRSLRGDATASQLVDDHSLRVQLLYACGCLRLMRPRHALLASRHACSALASLRVLSLVPPRAVPVFGPVHDHTRSSACGCDGRGTTTQLPAAKTAMRTHRESTSLVPLLFLRPFTLISHLTRHNKHTHEDTYREDIQRFQWRFLWLQWRSQRPTTTTAGSSPHIT